MLLEFKKENWNKFILENNGLFLQSWEWGEFQELLGRKIWRLGDGENWQAFVVKYDLPMGRNYLYCPGGPVLNSFAPSPQLRGGLGRGDVINIYDTSPQSPPQPRRGGTVALKSFLDEAKKIAKQEKSIFLRIEPFWEKGEIIQHARGINFKSLKFIKYYGGQRIEKTLILELNKTEDELLAEMKQKARYNIRLAEKHGVKIRISENKKDDFESFWKLTQETTERDKFSVHLREHYEKLLSICHSEFISESQEMSKQMENKFFASKRHDEMEAKLFVAEFDSKIIAANIIVFFGDRAIYLHGASSNEQRNLMAPYLLQWEQIKEARNRDCKIYDFWGIDEQKWPGVTKFKKGFGGKEIEHIGNFDYVFDKMWYWIYKFAKRIYKT